MHIWLKYCSHPPAEEEITKVLLVVGFFFVAQFRRPAEKNILTGWRRFDVLSGLIWKSIAFGTCTRSKWGKTICNIKCRRARLSEGKLQTDEIKRWKNAEGKI